ncbi:hypothetical protein GGS20DRAFT_213003 [Poronia punctata]|nr:hypothetical protein GGS20DRAFT_213003 [Poronia punctata]
MLTQSAMILSLVYSDPITTKKEYPSSHNTPDTLSGNRHVTSTDSRTFQEAQNGFSNPGAQQRVDSLIFARSENTRINRFDGECRYTQSVFAGMGKGGVCGFKTTLHNQGASGTKLVVCRIDMCRRWDSPIDAERTTYGKGAPSWYHH